MRCDNKLADELAQVTLRSHLFELATNEELIIQTRRLEQHEDSVMQVAHILDHFVGSPSGF